jgi:fibronectin-binding autotransporter adhesin
MSLLERALNSSIHCILLLVGCLASTVVLAQSQWNGQFSNNWFFADNWSPALVPDSGDVDIDTVEPNLTLIFEQAAGALDLLRVGVLDEGELWIRNGGSVDSVDGFIGVDPESLGSVWVDGPGSAWEVSSRIRVGSGGEGFLRIINGGEVTSNVSTLGLALDSFGGVLVRGADSRWASGTQLTIGWSGDGILIADQGGEVTNQNAWVGQNDGALGMVFVEGAGSRWDSGGFLTVGQGGAVGAFWVIEGAELESADAQIGVSGGNGFITLDDVGSSWTNTGSLEIGPSGGGTVIVSSGTLLNVGGKVDAGGQASTYGDLVVNGTLQAVDGVTLHEKGWLGGTGTVNALVTVEDGGVLAPGESAGTLSTGALVLQDGARLEFDLDAPGTVGLGVSDLVAVSGDLTLDGVVDVVDLGGFDVGTYTLLTYTGTLTDNGLTVGTMPDGFMAEVDTTVTGQVRLIVTSERIFRDRFEAQ